VKQALASIDKGGNAEAFARVAYLVRRRGDVPLSRLEAGQEMMKDYQEFLPPLELDAWRRVLGEQEIIATTSRTTRLQPCPLCCLGAEDRARLLTAAGSAGERSARPTRGPDGRAAHDARPRA
jgi:hypothetical protein